MRRAEQGSSGELYNGGGLVGWLSFQHLGAIRLSARPFHGHLPSRVEA